MKPFVRLIPSVYYRVNPVLPQAYDDSLSYFEVLAKLQKKINEIIETVNSMMDAIEELDGRLTVVERDVGVLKEQVQELFERISGFEESLANLNDRVTIVEGDITNIQGDILEIQGEMPEIATVSKAGLVKPDGNTITIDNDGTIHSVGGGGGGATDWNSLSGKPFNTLGDQFTVDGNSELGIKNASSSIAGVIKTYWDSATSTLYITDNGNSPVPI